ncbi:MAG: 50S ribosomal protein L15 [Deltaproteobacteria bacterium]|nr:50S ribosomal protein L15 [Deltaproteobacteria bacterium]
MLSTLGPPEGARRPAFRKGRGPGSGNGKTAGKGQKGQKARHPGNFSKLAFQGGQTPIQRRLPKRGFRSAMKRSRATVTLGQLAGLKQVTDGPITLALLLEHGLVPQGTKRVKVVATGTATGIRLADDVHATAAVKALLA